MSSFAQLVAKKRKAKQEADNEKETKALKLSQPDPEDSTHISSKVKPSREGCHHI